MSQALRIVAGIYRGRHLKSPPSLDVRPTSDRLRETLFNILAPRIEGARFLDLCAGTGAVGIEALSRGAQHVTFVDQSRKMCGLIEDNLHGLQIESDKVEVVNAEVMAFLRKRAKLTEPSLTTTPRGLPARGPRVVGLMPRKSPPFDLIFFDPPYAADYGIVNLVSDTGGQLMADDAIIIVEHHKKKELPKEMGTLRRYRTLKQGDSVLSFYKSAA